MTNEPAKIKLITPNATIPVQKTQGAAAYDINSAIACTIEPHSLSMVPADLTIESPQGCYIQIMP